MAKSGSNPADNRWRFHISFVAVGEIATFVDEKQRLITRLGEINRVTTWHSLFMSAEIVKKE